eukprot:763491-Hanusia_phi.AAC.4
MSSTKEQELKTEKSNYESERGKLLEKSKALQLDLEKAIQDKEAIRKEMQTTNENNEISVQKLVNEISILKETSSKHQKSIQDLHIHRSTLESEISKRDQQKADLEQKLSSAEGAVKRLKTEIDKNNETHQNDLEKLSANHNAGMKQKEAEMKNTISAMQEKFESSSKELRGVIEKQATEIEKKNKAAVQQEEQFTKQVQVFSGRLAKADEEISRLKQSLKESYDELLANQKSSREANDRNIEEIGKLRAQISSMKDAYTIAQDQIKKLEKEKRESDSEKVRIQGIAQSSEKAHLSDKQAMHKHIEDLNAAISRMNQENKALMDQVKRHSEYALKSDEERHSLQEEIRKKQTTISDLQRDAAVKAKRIEEIQSQASHERNVLHKQLQDANQKLALAAEALNSASAQSAEMSRLEIQMRALNKEKEQDRMKLSAMEHQLHQSESMYKMQMERTNERLKHYERALFDTRQVLAMKDTKIAQLETNISRLLGSDQGSSAQERQQENGAMRLQPADEAARYGRTPQMPPPTLQQYSPQSGAEQRSAMYHEANVSKVPLQVGSDESPIGVASVSTSNPGYMQRMPVQRGNEYYQPPTSRMQQMHPGRYDENQFF